MDIETKRMGKDGKPLKRKIKEDKDGKERPITMKDIIDEIV